MKKTAWIIFAGLAVLIGLYPLMYGFVEPQNTFLASKNPEIIKNSIWKTAFILHIAFGGLALLIGWRQFGENFRNRNIRLHRLIGKIYVIAVLISSLSGIYIGFYANGGIIAATGFIGLGIVWLATTVLAFTNVKKGKIEKHRKLMIYSYACSFAAVTLRIWLPLLMAISGDFIKSYLIVAWLCWIPNLIAAYFIIQSEKHLALQKYETLGN